MRAQVSVISHDPCGCHAVVYTHSNEINVPSVLCHELLTEEGKVMDLHPLFRYFAILFALLPIKYKPSDNFKVHIHVHE